MPANQNVRRHLRYDGSEKMRGIIISPPFKMEDNAFTLISSNIEPIKLRQYLLYWDRIDFPDNNLLSIGSSPEIQYLESAGVLNRSRILFDSWNGQNMGFAFAKMQTSVLEERNKSEEGRWSIAQPNSNLLFPKELGKITRSLEVELYQSIPIPSTDVNLEDILNFKEHHKDELTRFRILMDEFYLSIINSNDIPRAKVKVIDDIQDSIATLHRIMDESKLKRLLGTVKIELNITDMLKTSMAGIGTSAVFGFSPKLGAAIGLLSSTIKISYVNVISPKSLPKDLKDYAYLYHTHKELV